MSSEFDPEGPQIGWLLRSPQSVQMSAGPDSFHFSLQRTPETFNIQDSIPWINCASGNVPTYISQILICRIFNIWYTARPIDRTPGIPGSHKILARGAILKVEPTSSPSGDVTSGDCWRGSRADEGT